MLRVHKAQYASFGGSSHLWDLFFCKDKMSMQLQIGKKLS